MKKQKMRKQIFTANDTFLVSLFPIYKLLKINPDAADFFLCLTFIYNFSLSARCSLLVARMSKDVFFYISLYFYVCVTLLELQNKQFMEIDGYM